MVVSAPESVVVMALELESVAVSSAAAPVVVAPAAEPGHQQSALDFVAALLASSTDVGATCCGCYFSVQVGLLPPVSVA